MSRSFKYFGLLIFLLISFSLYSVTSISYCVKSPSLIYAGETYNVNITINKNSISGSSKFEVILPEGFIVNPINTSGANFVFEGNKAKFIWVILPSTESINLSYNITVPSSHSGHKQIYRKFFYVKDKKVHEEAFYSNINILKNDLLTNVNNTLKTTENNIKFKIQIGAFFNKVNNDSQYLKSISNYNIEEKYIGSYYKYFIGDFLSLDEAKQIKRNLGIKGAFIIAYKNKKQITINEAVSDLENY